MTRKLFSLLAAVLLLGAALFAWNGRHAQAEDTLTAGLPPQDEAVQAVHLADSAPALPAASPVETALPSFQPQSLTQDGVTVILAWVYADRERLSVEYTLEGLPIPEKYRHDCPVLEIHLYDEAGNLLVSLPGDDGYCLQDGQRVVQTFRPLPLPAAGDELSFALEIVLGGTVYPDGRFVDAPKEPATLPKISPFRFAVHVPVQNGLTFPDTQTVESAGRAVQVGDIEMYASLTAATVCADLPDTGDWLPVAELRLGDSVTPSDSLTLLDADSAATYTASRRCFRLTFPRGLDGAVSPAFDVVVTRLARSVPELPTPENCRKAQERLQKSHPEIAFECLAEGQGMGVHVTRKPEGMREEQALTLAWDAFRESVFGPWATAWPAP